MAQRLSGLPFERLEPFEAEFVLHFPLLPQAPLLPVRIVSRQLISPKTIAVAKGAEYIPANPELLETYFAFYFNVSLWGGLLAIVLAFLYIIKQHLSKTKTS